MTDRLLIAGALLRAGAIQLRPDDPFTFASGLRSPIYCDNRLMIGAIAERELLVAGFTAAVGRATVVAGTATAGIPWAAWVAWQSHLPLAYVRGSAKGHGRGRQIEGAPVAGQQIMLIEDTISTGESALNAAAALRNEQAILTECVCIFTWGWPATTAAFAAADIPLRALANLDDLLQVAVNDGFIARDQQRLIERWAADPHGWQG
ncbi:MAG TPA: orotate phosphoribosyltransferase [Roseiflexaceae bacterium]|nr:orotate phosphoribosyltransferase [Roseiflexaceae bacterium]HMP41497.1 orotate phosphoribosyltransferase [Roseiflexaceae bacterium]